MIEDDYRGADAADAPEARRTIRCEECGGQGVVTKAVNRGPPGAGYYQDERCPECDGQGELERRG